MPSTPSTADRALLVVDLAATVFLGIEGGMAAIEGRLDLFGVMVLSFATALGGGLVRDLLIGATPPASIRDARYPLAAFLGGGLAILLYQSVRHVPAALVVGIDAAGLGLFAVAGAAKALDYRIGPFMAVLMGTITGVGGGTIRDILLARVPAVLRVEIYAVAALAGAAVMVVGVRRGWPRAATMAAGALVCFLLRALAAWQQWNLPTIAGPIGPASSPESCTAAIAPKTTGIGCKSPQYRSRHRGAADLRCPCHPCTSADQSDFLFVENCVAICNATFATASLKS